MFLSTFASDALFDGYMTLELKADMTCKNFLSPPALLGNEGDQSGGHDFSMLAH